MAQVGGTNGGRTTSPNGRGTGRAVTLRPSPTSARRSEIVAGEDAAGPAEAGVAQEAPAPTHRRGFLEAKALAPIVRLGALFERRAFEEGSFQVGGLRLHYERHGKGPHVLVFLHGLLLDAQMNRRLAADLGAQGNHVILLELPGHGKSDKPRHASAHRMDSYAHHVIALLDELGIDQAVVGGVSLGANVSLQVAVQAPERVRGLIVEMPVLEWAVPAAAMVFLPLLLGVHYAAPVVRALAALVRRLPRTTIAPLDSFLSILSVEPEEAAAVLHGMLVGPVTPTHEDRLAIEAPTLVIGHRIDVIHPFTDADHLARQLPHARLVEARSIVELRVSPERLTAEIGSFLDEVWAGAAAGGARLRPARGGQA